MIYDEWIEMIEKLKKDDNKQILELIKNEEVNDNINEMVFPKLIDLVLYKEQKAIDSIIREIESIFLDVNYLDLVMVKFQKKLKFIIDLIELKQIPKHEQNELKNKLKEEIEQIYNILIEKSYQFDYTGSFELIIKNNKVKWS